MENKHYSVQSPESFMKEQADATLWFVAIISVTLALFAVALVLIFTVIPPTWLTASRIGWGFILLAMIGITTGFIYRRHYLKKTGREVLLLATPEPTKSSLTDMRAVVEGVGSLIKEYEHRTTKEIEGFEIQTAQLSALLAEAHSNHERLAAALSQMQRVLGLREGSEAVDSEFA